MKKIIVDCRHNGVLIKTYELAVFEVQPPKPELERRELEDECRSLLTRDRLASPPYVGITFTRRC